MAIHMLKSLGGTLLGIVIFVAVVTAITLFFVFGVKLAFAIAPTINWLAGILFLVDIILLLFALSRRMRATVGMIIFITSYVFGLATWIYGLAVTLSLWGIVALIIGLILGGVGVVPIGMLAALFHGEWSILVTLITTSALTYGSRMIATALIEGGEQQAARPTHRDNVIDIDSPDPKRTWEDID